MEVGLRLLRNRRFGEAANLLGTVAARHPDDARTPLFLYLARLQAGDAALAARELELRFAGDRERRWPVRSPISTSAASTPSGCWRRPARSRRWRSRMAARLSCSSPS